MQSKRKINSKEAAGILKMSPATLNAHETGKISQKWSRLKNMRNSMMFPQKLLTSDSKKIRSHIENRIKCSSILLLLYFRNFIYIIYFEIINGWYQNQLSYQYQELIRYRKNLNLESQEYWILNNLVFQAISNLENTELFRSFSKLRITQNNSVHFRKLQNEMTLEKLRF